MRYTFYNVLRRNRGRTTRSRGGREFKKPVQMNRAKTIIIGESLPIQTPFEKSVVQYWTNDRNANINEKLLEKIKLAKQQKLD